MNGLNSGNGPKELGSLEGAFLDRAHLIELATLAFAIAASMNLTSHVDAGSRYSTVFTWRPSYQSVSLLSHRMKHRHAGLCRTTPKVLSTGRSVDNTVLARILSTLPTKCDARSLAECGITTYLVVCGLLVRSIAYVYSCSLRISACLFLTAICRLHNAVEMPRVIIV